MWREKNMRSVRIVLLGPSREFICRLGFHSIWKIRGYVMNYKKFSGAASVALMIVIAVILMLAPGALGQSKYKTLHKFTGGADGGAPVAALILDAAGNLYSTTEYGGANKAGTLFKLTPTSGGGWTESVLYSFCSQSNCADGKNPGAGSLIFDVVGNLYGTASGGKNGKYCYDGCGVVFELTPTTSGGWTESVLYSFTGGADGAGPSAGLIFDTAGNLYGPTWQGAHITSFCYDGCGVVFKLTPGSNGWTESVLHTFRDKSDGSNSSAELILDSTGNLYGEAWNGGRYGYGNVFKLTPNSDGTWTEHVLHQFKGGKDGAEPQGRLIFDSAGNLYGTTRNFFSGGHGIVFKLVPNSDGTWTKHTLHQFTGGRDGAYPYAGLTFDSAGNLYGTTNAGGAYGYGVVFKLTPSANGGWEEKVLHHFMGGKDGGNPYAGLILDAAGNLYGTATSGGRGNGVVFEITP